MSKNTTETTNNERPIVVLDDEVKKLLEEQWKKHGVRWYAMLEYIHAQLYASLFEANKPSESESFTEKVEEILAVMTYILTIPGAKEAIAAAEEEYKAKKAEREAKAEELSKEVEEHADDEDEDDGN